MDQPFLPYYFSLSVSGKNFNLYTPCPKFDVDQWDFGNHKNQKIGKIAEKLVNLQTINIDRERNC